MAHVTLEGVTAQWPIYYAHNRALMHFLLYFDRTDPLNLSMTGSAPVLDGVNLQIAAGSRVAIRGKRGAGRSTLLRILAGLVRPFSGRRHIDASRIAYIGERPVTYHPKATLRDIARLEGYRLGITRQDVLNVLARLQIDPEAPAASLPEYDLLAFEANLAVRFACDFLLIDGNATGSGAELITRLRPDVSTQLPADGIVVATHDPGDPSCFYDRAILIEQGSIQDMPVTDGT